MNSFFKRFMASCSAVALVSGLCTYSIQTLSIAADSPPAKCHTYYGTNVNQQNYIKTASPIKTYLSKSADGTLMRFRSEALNDGYLVEYLGNKYATETMLKVDMELPIFGGFYETDDYNFILSGQSNPEELPTVECFRITKYDKNWKRLGSAALYDCNTTTPFYAGTARFAEDEGYLFVRTSHEMYQIDGINHQANVTIQLDIDSMKITDHITDILWEDYGYVSHSFNQFIHTDNGRLIALDHGDASPRELALIKYNTDYTDGTFTPDMSTFCSNTSIVKFPEATKYHYNYTGASVGGFEISETSYITAYSSESYDDNTVDETTRNIHINTVNKATNKITDLQLTEYEDGTESVSTPHLIKLEKDKFILLWYRDKNVYYTLLDENGNPDTIYTFQNAYLSDCVPVVSGEKLVWFVWEDNLNVFYEINLDDLSETKAILVNNSHEMEIVSIPDKAGANCCIKCAYCDETTEFPTPKSVRFAWNTKSDEQYSLDMPQTIYKNDTLYCWTFDNYFEGDYNEYIFNFSNPDAVDIITLDKTLLVMNFIQEGMQTLTVNHKYNPHVTATVTFKVEHNKEHTLVKYPAEKGEKTGKAKCSDCNYTEEFTVITDFRTGHYKKDNVYEEGLDGIYCPSLQTRIVVDSEENADNREFTIEIGDKTVADFKQEFNNDKNFWGTINWLKEGETAITLYPTYNPAAKKTYSINVAHHYEDGNCVACGLNCKHEGLVSSGATCTGLSICQICGSSFGTPNPENHSSNELIYIPSETDAETHNTYYACCNQLKGKEHHNFNFDNKTSEYICQCGKKASTVLKSDGTVKYYADFTNALAAAQDTREAIIEPLTDIITDSFDVKTEKIKINLNGKNINISKGSDNGYGIQIGRKGTLTIEDSIGSGSIIAPAKTDLIFCGGILNITNGTFISENNVIYAPYSAYITLNGGKFNGECCVKSETKNLTLNGIPEIKSETADFILKNAACINVTTNLGNSAFSVKTDKYAVIAQSDNDTELNAKWFTNISGSLSTICGDDNTLYSKAKPVIEWVRTSTFSTYNGNEPLIPDAIVTLLEGDSFNGEIHYSYRPVGSEVSTEGLPVNAGKYEITASIDEDKNYISAQTTEPLILTINKIKPDIKVILSSDNKEVGSPLPGISYTGDTKGNIKWTTVFENGLSPGRNDAEWLFTPEDPINYESVGGKITIAVAIQSTTTAKSTTSTTKTITETSAKVTSTTTIPLTKPTTYKSTTLTLPLTKTTITKTTASFSPETTTNIITTKPIVTTENPYIKGDVNYDGKIDSADASAVLEEYAIIQTGGEESFAITQKKAADVNDDSKTDSTDASSILQYYALISTGGKPSWEDCI